MGEELFKSGSGSVDHLVVAGWTDMNKVETMSFKLGFSFTERPERRA